MIIIDNTGQASFQVGIVSFPAGYMLLTNSTHCICISDSICTSIPVESSLAFPVGGNRPADLKKIELDILVSLLQLLIIKLTNFIRMDIIYYGKAETAL